MISAFDKEEAFPKLNFQFKPFGGRVLVQMRRIREKTASGIILHTDTKEFNRNACQVGIVLALGPLAYKDRDTRETWPEGVWCREGDMVRVPKYGGDRFLVPYEDDAIMFCVFLDHEILGGLSEEHVHLIDDIL